MEASAVSVVADFDLGVGQSVQFLDGFRVCSSHVGGGYHPQLATVLGKGSQLLQDQPQAAPLDKGHQHVDPVSARNLLFQLREHLGLVQCAGEQTAAG